MKRSRTEAEWLADEMLRALGKELGAARADFCEALMDPDREDPPMFLDEEVWPFRNADKEAWDEDKDDDWDVDWDDDWDLPPAAEKPAASAWETARTVTARKGSKRRVRRALLVAAVMILVMGLALVAAEGVKLKKSNLYMEEDTGQSTRIIDMDKAEFDVEDFNVTYVPEGYELVEDVVVSDISRMIKYHSKEYGGIQIHIAKTENFGANVDNETAGRTEVLVNDKQAYLFNDDTTSVIVWQIGDCTLDIAGRVTEEELIEVASHIYVD